MNVERIELSNFGSWESLDLSIEPGMSLISGANGAGKSTLLAAVSFALFGATSDAGRLIRRGTDEACAIVYLDDGLVVTRSVRRSGASAKIALSVERAVDEESFESLTAATVTETQAILDGLLGVSREVLEASAFSMQGRGGDFCEANPRDRKRAFAEILALGFWDTLAEDAKLELKAARSRVELATAALETLDGAAARLIDAVANEAIAKRSRDVADLAERDAEALFSRLAGEAEQARTARREHALAIATEREAEQAHDAAERDVASANEALDRASAAAANAPSVDDALAEVAEASRHLRLGETEHRGRIDVARDYEVVLVEARRSVTELRAESETGDCVRCGQPLADASLPARLMAAETALRGYEENPPPAPDDAALAVVRERAQAAATRLAEAEMIQSLAGSIDDARTRAAHMRTRETAANAKLAQARIELGRLAESVAYLGDAEQRHEAAVAQLADARAAHSSAGAELARAEEAAKIAERDAQRETVARASRDQAEQEAAIASILAAGFGPTGVPALIVDNVLGDLADETNRVLAELGSPIRCDLRSQKLLKTSDRLADTLDIIALMDGLEAPYETLSGGERTRLALALRAALTRLLASKRGSRVRLLVVDEPAGLDSTGCEQLAGVLNEFTRAGVFETVLLITHQGELAEQIARVIRIEKTPGGTSRLVDCAVAEAARDGVVPAGRTRDETLTDRSTA